MAEERISEYINEAAIQKQTDFFLAQLNSLKAAYAEINNSKISLQGAGGTKEFTDALKSSAAATREAARAQDELTKSTIANEKAVQASIKTEREREKFTQDQIKTDIQQTKAQQEKIKTDLQEEKLKQQELKTQQQRIAENKKAAAEDTKNAKLKASFDKAERDEILAIQKEIDKRAKIAVTAGKAEEKIANDLANDYKQLSLAYADAALKAKNLALQQGTNAPAAKAALAEANALGAKLKEVDAATGGFQRNVGNYAGAIGQAFSKTFNFLRTAANIIPGLGISGILLLAYDGIVAIVEAAFKGEKALNRLADAHRSYSETLVEGSKNSAREIVNLRVLEQSATNMQKPMAVRLQAVKDLKEEYPKYLKGISDEAILNGEAAAQINLVADALFKKSFAEAASSRAADIAGKQLDLELRRNFLINENVKVQKEYNEARRLNATDENGVNVAALSAEKHLTEINKLLTKNVEQYDFNNKQIDFFTKKAVENSDALLNLEKPKKLPKAKKSNEDFNDDTIKAQNETGKLLIQAQQDLYKSVFDNDRNNYQVRLDALENYEKARKQMFALEIQNDIKANDEKRSNDLKGEGLSIKQKSAIILSAAIERKNIEKKYGVELQKFELDQDKIKEDLRLKSLVSNQEKRFDYTKSFADDEAKLYDEISQRQITIFQTQSALEQAELTKRYAERKISKEQYEQGILNITEKYGRLGLQEQAKWLAEEIKLLPAGTKAREDAERKLAELQILLNKRVLTQEQITFQQRAQLLEGYLKKAQSVANEAFNFVGQFVDIGTTKQKNANQELDDQRQKTYENDIARINASSATQEEKVRSIQLLDAQRQAQKEKLERDQRQLDLQRARFEKAANITRIIAETSLAVVHQLASGDPYTAFGRAIAAGALGAIRLGLAIAAPLPKFKHGKFNDYEGLAITGDGGKREPIVRADGRIEMSPNTPTLTWVGKRDIVYPDIEALRNRVAMSQTDRVLSNGMLSQQNSTIDLKPLERKLDGVINAYNSRPVHETVWTERGVIERVKHGFSETEYINKHVRGK